MDAYMNSQPNNKHKSKLGPLVLGAIGVVYGDIGTSPLYTLKSIFSESYSLPVTEESVLGILSIIFWSLILVVSLKYIVFVMRADNQGEGGVMALTALTLKRVKKKKYIYLMLMGLGIFGASLFYGDSVITPAISVLSAIEGLRVAAPRLHHTVLPLTVIVLILLFILQRRGTNTIGNFFGPIMIVWFFTIAILGIISVIDNPSVLRAINPYHAVKFFTVHKYLAFLGLGATFLALTGAEALYADMGHFGLSPIRISWFSFIFPALILNYFGQGALLLKDSSAVSNPFYLLAPNWMLYPLIFLATASTIIASQAVITGTFSMTQEAIRLGYLPRLGIRFTSEEEKGQIYIPEVNWLLLAIVISVVLGFKTSDNLATAYGLSVSGTMIITTILAFGVIARLWKVSRWIMIPILGIFFLIDLSFLGANAVKFLDGGWLPLLIALLMFTLMTTWTKGVSLLRMHIAAKAVRVDTFVKKIAELAPLRVQGTGIFMTPNLAIVPSALFYNLAHNKVLHERVVLLRVEIQDIPHIDDLQRIEITTLKEGSIYTILAKYGFKDDINIPEALKLCEQKGVKFNIKDTTFFIGKTELILGEKSDMAQWRKRLFIDLFRNSSNFIHYCKIPADRLIELGTSVEF